MADFKETKSIPAVTLSLNDSEDKHIELSAQGFDTPAPHAPSDAMYSEGKLQIGQKTLEKLLALLKKIGIHKPVQDLSNDELMAVLKKSDISQSLQAELGRNLPKLRQALYEVDIAIQKAENGQIDWSSAGASMAASIVLEKEKDKKYEQGIEDNFERLKEITTPDPTFAPQSTTSKAFHLQGNNQVMFYDRNAEASALVEQALDDLSPEAAAEIDPEQLRATGIKEALVGVELGGMPPVSPFSAPRAISKALKTLEEDNDNTPTPFTSRQH